VSHRKASFAFVLLAVFIPASHGGSQTGELVSKLGQYGPQLAYEKLRAAACYYSNLLMNSYEP